MIYCVARTRKNTMKTLLRVIVVGALLGILSVAIAADAADPAIGTWKLNPEKSTRSALMFKSETRTYTAVPAGIEMVWVRVTADNATSTVKTTFKYDGADYPVMGSADFDAISGKSIDANTVETTQKHMGKKVGTTRRTVSADGKTMTLHQLFTTADGHDTGSLLVYDRQ
jgi:hypothetical protein